MSDLCKSVEPLPAWNTLRVAIHPRSKSFSNSWIRYCESHGVPYRIVNCFSSSIVADLQDVDILLWHWPHYDPLAAKFAGKILAAVEAAGTCVFPNTPTAWHFDDKVAQKFLLEAIRAPLIPTHVFFSKKEALSFTRTTDYPVVWKLRNGAGSSNVVLLRTAAEARRQVGKAFGRGSRPLHATYLLKEALRRGLSRGVAIYARSIAVGLVALIAPRLVMRGAERERGYAYFQTFVPGNDSDIRVVVIGERAIAIKRMVRDGDFRASGSGQIDYDPDMIPIECVAIAFDVSRKLRAQSLAFDFVQSTRGWEIIEISYGFSEEAYFRCPGYWDRSLNWLSAPVRPAEWIISDAINAVLGEPTGEPMV